MLYPIFFYIVFASAGFLVDKRLQGAYSYEFEASLCCHSHSVLQRALTVPLSMNFIDYFLLYIVQANSKENYREIHLKHSRILH